MRTRVHLPLGHRGPCQNATVLVFLRLASSVGEENQGLVNGNHLPLRVEDNTARLALSRRQTERTDQNVVRWTKTKL